MNQYKEIALVTGASQGIGKTTAQKLAENGNFVIGTSRTKTGAEHISKFLHRKGKGIVLNITDPNDIEKKLKKIYIKFKSIDILVNNAGTNFDNVFTRISINEWKQTIDINLNSVFYLSQSVIRNMLKKKRPNNHNWIYNRIHWK